MKILKAVIKVVGVIVKVIVHAVQVHKEKKAAAAAAAAKQKESAPAGTNRKHLVIAAIVAGALLFLGTVWLVFFREPETAAA